MALASKSQLALFSYLVYEPPPVNQFIPPIGWVLVPALSEQDSVSGGGIKQARLPPSLTKVLPSICDGQ